MKKLLAIGLATAALAAAPAFASSPPPTATAGPPTLTVAGAKDVDYTLLRTKGLDLTAADKMAGYSIHLRVTANDARSPLTYALTADKTRPASESGMKALAQKKAPEGTAKKLLAASAMHPGIGIAWASAPAANAAKTIAVMVAGEKYVMNAATIRTSPSITLKI